MTMEMTMDNNADNDDGDDDDMLQWLIGGNGKNGE